MAQQHPPFPSSSPEQQYITHIWAYSALKADAALSRLQSLGNATARRPGKAAADTTTAIWTAVTALSEDLIVCAKKAQERGELLFCWHGTQATTKGQERA